MHGTITNSPKQESRGLKQPADPAAPAHRAGQSEPHPHLPWLARIGGLRQERHVRHYHRPSEPGFHASEREDTTILFGGLTWKHEALIVGFMRGLGYTVESLPTPDLHAHRVGREFCNNGQCNPTYFTVGNLIRELQRREAEGLTREEIIRRFVFFTAGACGPCRFGMYESEYRNALAAAGYAGFRVLIVEQEGGLQQSDQAAGLAMDLDFTLGLLHGFNIGDVLNDLASQLRPYELHAGDTDAALAESISHMAEVLEREYRRYSSWMRFKTLRRYASHIFGDRILAELRVCRMHFEHIRCDRTRVKPVVKITGEFWAQTTEGDGNFRMFRFLEREGAQVILEPIATWLQYMLHQARQESRDIAAAALHRVRGPVSLIRAMVRTIAPELKKRSIIRLAERLYERDYNRMRRALHNVPMPLPDQDHFRRLAAPYYNTRIEGGEGHLEVAKTMYYTQEKLCHMVLSVKPFGCLPSTQSDGVQSAVCAHHPDILFLPIETSGDGEIHAHSRVQMVLGEARRRAEAEFREVCSRHGLSVEKVRALMMQDAAMMNPFFLVPPNGRQAAVAARFAELLVSRRVSDRRSPR